MKKGLSSDCYYSIANISIKHSSLHLLVVNEHWRELHATERNDIIVYVIVMLVRVRVSARGLRAQRIFRGFVAGGLF